MKNKRQFSTIVLTLLISVSAIMAIGISNVSAQPPPPHPEIVIRPGLVTGTTDPTIPPYGYATYYVNIKNAPHTDAEVDPPNVDRTWSWQVELEWDPTVLGDPFLAEDTYTLPGKTATLLGYFTYWVFVPTPFPHWEEKPYPRGGLTTPPAPWGGAVTIFDGLKSTPDPTTVTIGVGDPNPGLHYGSNYDLPYSEGIDLSVANPISYGPNELNLFMASFPILKDGPPYASVVRINMDNTWFWCHDATTTYHVNRQLAWFGSWHELYPVYSQRYAALEYRDDSGDGVLSYCDEILLESIVPPGPPMWYHVEEVTVTLALDEGPEPLMYIEYDCCEDDFPEGYPFEPIPWPLPMGTQWHEKYPVFSRRYTIVNFIDEGDGFLGVSDYILLENKETGETIEWHVAEVATDIIVTPEPDKEVPEFPLGIGLMMIMALVIPTAYVWRLRRKVTKQ